MDFLGLRNLTVIHDAEVMIKIPIQTTMNVTLTKMTHRYLKCFRRVILKVCFNLKVAV